MIRKSELRCVPRVVILSLFSGLLAHPALAVDFQWNVAGPADWNVGTNWNPAGPPSGGGGNHAFVNNGGTAEISANISDIQDIFVGAGAGTSGTLNQSGGSTFQGTGSWMFVGQDGGTGTYNLSGGTQNKARLFIGRGAGGNGTLNMTSAGAINGEELNVGVDGATGAATLSDNATVITTGLVQVQNGSMIVKNNASISGGGEYWVGQGGGHSATLDMDSGSIETKAWIAVGRDSGTGVVNLSGTARLAKVAGNNDAFITLGGLGAGSGGTINISGNAVLESDTGMVVAETAGRYGIVNQSGGTVNLHDYANVNFGKSLYVQFAATGTGEYHLSGGSLNAETIDATKGLFDMTGGVLSAKTFQGNLIQKGGRLSPGSSPGTTTITGNYALNSGDLLAELNGLTAGSGYDQLIVTGDVSLAGDLTLAVGFAPSLGDMFTIIDNQGANPISGMFSQGTSISSGGFAFGINYSGGDGNDVVLRVVPEPASLALIAMGALGLIDRRRRGSGRLGN